MSEKNTDKNPAAPKEPTHAFTTWTNPWKSEMQRFLDESSAAAERSFVESERLIGESSRLFAAQTRVMHDASRAVFAGFRTMMG